MLFSDFFQSLNTSLIHIERHYFYRETPVSKRVPLPTIEG